MHPKLYAEVANRMSIETLRQAKKDLKNSVPHAASYEAMLVTLNDILGGETERNHFPGARVVTSHFEKIVFGTPCDTNRTEALTFVDRVIEYTPSTTTA